MSVYQVVFFEFFESVLTVSNGASKEGGGGHKAHAMMCGIIIHKLEGKFTHFDWCHTYDHFAD